MSFTFWRRTIIVVLMTMLFGQMGSLLSGVAQHESAVWPASGVAVAAAILWGKDAYLGVLLGNLIYLHLVRHQPFGAVVGIGIGNTVGAFVAASGLRRMRFNPRLERVRDVTLLIVIGMLFSQAIGATVGPLSRLAFGIDDLAALPDRMMQWWAGNIFGTIWVTPFLLWLRNREPAAAMPPMNIGRRIEMLALAASFSAFLWLFLADEFAALRTQTYLVRPHTLYPFFVWGTLRFRQRGATLLGFVALTALGMAIYTGNTPYKTLTAGQTFQYLQSFMSILALTSLFLGAAVEQYHETLRRLNASERATRKREAEFRAIFEFSGAGHAQLDPHTGRFLKVNAKLCDVIGYPASELVGRRFSEMTYAEDMDLSEGSFKDLTSGRLQEVSLEKRYLRGDGRVIWVSVTATCMRAPDGTATKTLAVMHDITARKAVETELKQAKDAADTASLAKSQFLANISHEIRTPLGAILGFNEFSFDPRQTAEDREECAQKIKDNGDLLLKIINDVLDLSKIEASHLEMERYPTDIAELLGDVESLLRFKAEENGTALTVRSEGEIPAMIESDPTRLRQILVNVVGNAVKFSEKGRVNLVVRHLPATAATPRALLEFSVEDTGLGIAPAQAERIFEPFHQADLSTTRRFGGTGLGLALARRFAQALNGDLTLAASTPGKGSTFVIHVEAVVPDGTPFYRHVPGQRRRLVGATAAGNGVAGASLKNIRALVVDDALDNRILITRFLEREGAEVVQAESGEEALVLALQQHFDILLIDIQMPGLDGLQATQILRANGFKRPILAVTASAMKDDRVKALQAGFDDHISKPVNPKGLITSVRRFIET